MKQIGPPLEPLLRRLAETPDEFLGEPKIGRQGTVAVSALVYDVLSDLGVSPDSDLLAQFASKATPDQRNVLKLVMIAMWLLADEKFSTLKLGREALAKLLRQSLPELAAQSVSDHYVRVDQRREELVRTVLARLGYRPECESEEQASDRLSRISSTEHARLLRASRAAEERAREVREALARKAAQESADKWTRE